jgi:glutamate-1-semialdehyde aminotransferase
MTNGFSQGAAVGTSEVMQAAQGSFISSTYWTERVGPAAAIAAIQKMKRLHVSEHLVKMGTAVMEGWKEKAGKSGLEIETGGIKPLGHFSFKYKEPLVLKTLFTQYMLEEGYLATTAYYASYAHKENHVKKYLEASGRAFEKIAADLKTGQPEKSLKGPVCHSGFKRLN